MHTSTHSTSFLFPGPFPWQSSLSLTMRIQFRPVGPLILLAASCSYVYVACAALARSCKCTVLHGAVPQPAANDAAARQNVAALIECARPAYQPASQQQQHWQHQLLPLRLLQLLLLLPPCPPAAAANGQHTALTATRASLSPQSPHATRLTCRL